VTTRGSISSAMTRFFGQADPFSTQRAKLARVSLDIKGMHYLQSDDFSFELSLGFRYSSSLCYPNTLKVFRRLCFLLRIGFFERGMLAHSMLGCGPSNCLFRASSAFKLFEAGLRSLELSFSGQQCLQVIRGRALVL
jgi:hypothetical protein